MVIKENNKGFWTGRAGKSAGADDNEAARLEHFSILQTLMLDAINRQKEIEQALDKAGVLLTISQPPMIGKIALRWWKRKGDERYREPVLVKWIMQNNGVMTPKPIKRLNNGDIRSDNGFALNHKETAACVNIIRDLLTQRQMMKKRLRAIQFSLKNTINLAMYIDNEKIRLEELQAKVTQKLLDHGYPVEEKYLSEESHHNNE
jgi:hypothetical protein